jgi:hypothetical protein
MGIISHIIYLFILRSDSEYWKMNWKISHASFLAFRLFLNCNLFRLPVWLKKKSYSLKTITRNKSVVLPDCSFSVCCSFWKNDDQRYSKKTLDPPTSRTGQKYEDSISWWDFAKITLPVKPLVIFVNLPIRTHNEQVIDFHNTNSATAMTRCTIKKSVCIAQLLLFL